MGTELDGQTALVTGAGRGNGRASAKLLAESGANLVINDIDVQPAQDTASEINDAGHTAKAIKADITNREEVKEMFNKARDEFKSIDILVNNAGIANTEPFKNKSPDKKWQQHLQVLLWGPIYCCEYAIEDMIEQQYGKIINITSIHTKNGVGGAVQYDVAKFGLVGLTKSLALELGSDGIRTNAVAPGWVKTRMGVESMPEKTAQRILDLNPLGQFAEPEDIGEAVLWLASSASDYVNGEEIRVDGGQVPIDNFRYRDQDN